MRPFLPLAALLLLGGCQTVVPFSTAPDRSNMSRLAEVRGFVSYMQRIALPPDAQVMVNIVDAGSTDLPPVATTSFVTNGAQVPIPFTLSYDPVRMIDNRHYVLTVLISDGAGRALWRTESPYPLPEEGRPVDIPVTQASGG